MENDLKYKVGTHTHTKEKKRLVCKTKYSQYKVAVTMSSPVKNGISFMIVTQYISDKARILPGFAGIRYML